MAEKRLPGRYRNLKGLVVALCRIVKEVDLQASSYSMVMDVEEMNAMLEGKLDTMEYSEGEISSTSTFLY